MIYPDMPDELTNYYFPRQWMLDDDGTLAIKVTGYDEETTHYTGFRHFRPSAPDYNFWVWMVQEKKPDGIIPREKLGPFREEYSAMTEPSAA